MKAIRGRLLGVAPARRRMAESARARVEIRRLRHRHTPDALLLARLLESGTRRRLEAEDRRWIRRIETARRSMAQSAETVRRGDGGEVPLGDVTRRASLPPRSGRLLYGVVRAFRPTRGVEIGDSVGISAAYQAAALTASGTGWLVSLAGQEELAGQAEKLWSTLGLRNVEVVVGRRPQALEPVIAAGSLDYGFVHGGHHEEATVEHFRRLRDQCHATMLLVVDGIRASEAMRRAWDGIHNDACVSCYADLGRLGLVIVRPVS